MYQLGKKVSDEGYWADYSDAKLLIGRAGSVEFLKAQEELERPYKKKIDKGTLSASIKREISLKSLAKAILLDWKDVAGADGKSIAYTEELGYQALLDDPDLLEFVMDIALDNENFRTAQDDNIVKKSQKQ